MPTKTSASRPASSAHVTVVTGGRHAVANAIEHLQRGQSTPLEPTTTEIPPERVAALTAVLERSRRIEFGAAPPVGHEADWLTEGLGRGERRIGALGVVLTVGKGLSVLAEADARVDEVVTKALEDAARAYVDHVATHAMTRVGPAGEQTHVPIDPASLRAIGWMHGHSAAGDPHRHAHIMVGTTINIPGDDRARAIHTQHYLAEVAQAAEGAARVAMIQSLAEHGIKVDPLSLDLAGINEDTLAQLDRFSAMRSVVLEAEQHGLSHHAAWTAARRALKTDDRQSIAEHLRPLVEQVRAWADTTWHLPTPEGEVALRLSNVEALEHALDALTHTPEGRNTVLAWHNERSAGAWQDLVNELHRVVIDQRRVTLRPDEIVPDYIARLGRAAESGQVLTRDSLRSHAQAIATAHDFNHEAVNDLLQEAFIEAPRRRGLIAVAELNATLTLAQQALARLLPVKTVDQALRSHTGLTIIQGVAGAGKTTAVVRAATDTWAHESGQVWVLSRNAKTAYELGRAIQDAFSTAGADAQRVRAMPLKHPGWRSQVRPGDRIVVDEFALSERNDLTDLVNLSYECPVSLLGDTHQQRAIETPTAAQVLAHVAQQANQPHLEHSVRCAAWHDLHDDLRAAPTDPESRERAVATLDIREVASATDAMHIAQSEGALLLTATNALAAEAAAGAARPTGPTVAVRHGVEVGIGDAVTFRAIVRDQHRHVLGRTGDVATVVKIGTRGILLEHDDGRRVVLSHSTAREALAAARVQTIDSAQGRTVERAAVLITGTEDAHALYTACTRGKQAPLILVLREQPNETNRGLATDHPDPHDVVRDVLTRSTRSPLIGLNDADTAMLVSRLTSLGYKWIADRLTALNEEINRARQLSVASRADQPITTRSALSEKEKRAAMEALLGVRGEPFSWSDIASTWDMTIAEVQQLFASARNKLLDAARKLERDELKEAVRLPETTVEVLRPTKEMGDPAMTRARQKAEEAERARQEAERSRLLREQRGPSLGQRGPSLGF